MTVRPIPPGRARGGTAPDDAPAPVAGDGEVLVSIIVVSWNVRELLLDCLQSLLDEWGGRGGAMQVILVDNASSDGTVEAVRERFPWVELVANQDNVGFGRANNQALPRCRGRFVLLLNPDTVVLDRAVDRMIAHMEPLGDVAAMACRLLNSDGSFQRWTAGSFPSVRSAAVHAFFLDRILPRGVRPGSMYLSEDVGGDVDVDWVSGACMLLRREALGDSIFDESFFMYGEDTDLCDRLHRAGWRVVYSPCATVVHHAGRSMSKQSGAILLTSFKGPRLFYRARNGNATVVLYDMMVATGFLLRTVAYAGIALLRRNRESWARVTGSWSYTRRAMQVMIGR